MPGLLASYVGPSSSFCITLCPERKWLYPPGSKVPQPQATTRPFPMGLLPFLFFSYVDPCTWVAATTRLTAKEHWNVPLLLLQKWPSLQHSYVFFSIAKHTVLTNMCFRPFSILSFELCSIFYCCEWHIFRQITLFPIVCGIISLPSHCDTHSNILKF